MQKNARMDEGDEKRFTKVANLDNLKQIAPDKKKDKKVTEDKKRK